MEHARRAAEDVARRAYGGLLARLARGLRDVALAEEALGDALRIALERWPVAGVPANPEAWLAVVARRMAFRALRRAGQGARAAPVLALLEEERMDRDAAPDHRLGLMLACAHPGIEPGVRAPLILQCVLGYDAAAVASAFLVAPATMGQRLSRAKARIRAAGLRFETPEGAEAAARIAPALDAVYAAFGLSWAEPTAGGPRRRDLSADALWLAGLLARLAPQDAEAQGLHALLLHVHARRAARRSPSGAYVPLEEQDLSLWDHDMIAQAEAALRRAAALGAPGRFQLEAAIQSVHAARAGTGRTDHAALLALYGALRAMAPSIGAAAGHAAALGAAGDPAAGLALLDALPAEPCAAHQPWWAVRADLLARLSRAEPGRAPEARAAYARAAGLSEDAAVRRFLIAQAART